MPEHNTPSKYLIAWGIGGCYSGYTHALIANVDSKEEACAIGYRNAVATRKTEGYEYRYGCSYITEVIYDDVTDTALYKSALKPTAKFMLDNKYAAKYLVDV